MNKLSLRSISAIPDTFIIKEPLDDDQFQKALVKLEILLNNDQFQPYTSAVILQLLPLLKQNISMKKIYIIWSIRLLLSKKVIQDSLLKIIEVESAVPPFRVILDLLVESFQIKSKYPCRVILEHLRNSIGM